MTPIVVVAGLGVDLYDRFKKESALRFAPNGHLLAKPVRRPGYPQQQASEYLVDITKIIAEKDETERVSVQLLQTDYGDSTSQKFMDEFFPFALRKTLSPIMLEPGCGRNAFNRKLNDHIELIARHCGSLRKTARVVSEKTNIHNITPLLLPMRNFQSEYYKEAMMNLFLDIAESEDPQKMLDNMAEEFHQNHPRSNPPGASRYAFNDGVLYFKSPGSDRHGNLRHGTKDEHGNACFPNAKCRLGGPYDHKFHYDCEPVRGKLKAHYPSCHGQPGDPKKKHVNIAPNDFIV